MELDIVKNKKIWIPPRTWGVCIWVLPDGKALMDSDGNALSAEGFVDVLLGFMAQEKLATQKEKIRLIE